MFKASTAIASAALLAATLTAKAAPVSYDEAVSGDLGGNPVTSLAFDLGINTVKGSMSFYQLLDASGALQLVTDPDPIELRLASGTTIANASVEIQFTPLNANTISFEWEWYLTDFAGGNQFGACLGILTTSLCPIDAPNGGPLFSGDSIPSANYLMTNGGSFQASNVGAEAGGTFNYTLFVTVAAVPEPGTLPLCATLGLLAIARRRSKPLNRPTAPQGTD